MRALLLRPLAPALCALAVAAVAAGACSDDPDAGDERAEQVRLAALDAGLDGEVAGFLGLAARGQTATYQATYPGPDEGSELVVANDPPDRRIDVLVDDRVVEVRLVTDGEAFRCARDPEAERITTCERTDAVVEGPGSFGDAALEELTTSLQERSDDFTFRIDTTQIAGVEARCLVTEVREGRERPELGSSGSICVSEQGALLRVDRDGESLEATDYTTDIPDDTFVRPDRSG